MPQEDQQLFDVTSTQQREAYNHVKAEDDARLERIRAENKVLVAAGYAIVLTPCLVVVLGFLSSAYGFELKLDPQILRYCVIAAGTVVSYLFGKNVFQFIWRRK